MPRARNGRAGDSPNPQTTPSRVAATDIVTSRENRWLKEFRVALRGGLATTSGAVGVEGVRLVEEALTSGCPVEAVLFSESGERYRDRLAPLVGRPETGFPVLRTTERLFEGIADTEHPQGVAALVVPRASTLEQMVKARTLEEVAGPAFRAGPFPETKQKPCAALLVVLAGVQDPGNVGTIVRTAAAFGATGIVTAASGQSGTASPFAPKAMRASAGAALHLPILTGMALAVLLTQLKLLGIRTVASCAHQFDEKNSDVRAPWQIEWCEPTALLVGNEGAGLPEDIVHAADTRIHIPVATQVESLNAAAAAAVVLYEAYRQRSQ
ncbi:MAG: RNA methyltransferase [Candidatus Acidiferrum sp.]|jgi:TrmH family RNA methyltransferase